MTLINGKTCASYEQFLADANRPHYGWRVAIPTYRRAETLRKKTLKMLAASSVPADRIDIFVANEEERATYERVLPREWYSRIVVALPGLRHARNFISRFYPQGQRIVSLDDDLTRFEMRTSEKKVNAAVPDLAALFDYGFALADEIGTGVWGVYPCAGLSLRRNIRTNLCYLIGFAWGCVLTRDASHIRELEDKEDFEFSILQCQRYGKVCRIEYVSARTNCYTEPGGMQETRTEARVKAGALHLLKKYPLFTRPRIKNGHAEIRLVDPAYPKGRCFAVPYPDGTMPTR